MRQTIEIPKFQRAAGYGWRKCHFEQHHLQSWMLQTCHDPVTVGGNLGEALIERRLNAGVLVATCP